MGKTGLGFLCQPCFRLVHSHWSRSIEALLWLVEIMVLLQLSYAIKTQHKRAGVSNSSNLISDIGWTSLIMISLNYLKSRGGLLSWPSRLKWEARLTDFNGSLSYIRDESSFDIQVAEKTTKFLFQYEIYFFNQIRGVEYINHPVFLSGQGRHFSSQQQ